MYADATQMKQLNPSEHDRAAGIYRWKVESPET